MSEQEQSHNDAELKTPATTAKPQRHPHYKEVTMEGHLLDNDLLGKVLDCVVEAGGDFDTLELRAGMRRENTSFARLAIGAPTEQALRGILNKVYALGAKAKDADAKPARLEEVTVDGVAPKDFYSSTIFPTDVRIGSKWVRATGQRMDGMIVIENLETGPTARITLMRDLKKGDQLVVGHDGVEIHPPRATQEEGEDFEFMSSDVSSERRVELVVENLAKELIQLKERGGKIVLVPGPVTVHTGSVPFLCELVRGGYVQALLSGNALAVHDIESALYGTSLGIDLERGVGVPGGHRHHLDAINAMRGCGGIAKAVEQGVLKSGLMYELTKHNIPYCLAGSIRDDGPLLETEMDLNKAQARYQELIEGADLILMLSTMLHSIGVGNMTPAGVKLVCVDISPAVTTKLSDRGSMESIPIVTDVGLFLNLLVSKIKAYASYTDQDNTRA